jgi:hypothetical protein
MERGSHGGIPVVEAIKHEGHNYFASDESFSFLKEKDAIRLWNLMQ